MMVNWYFCEQKVFIDMKEGNIIKCEQLQFRLQKILKAQGYKQTWLSTYQKQGLPKKVVLKFTDIYARDQDDIKQQIQIQQQIKHQYVASPLFNFQYRVEGQLYLVTVTQYYPNRDFSNIIDEPYLFSTRYLYLLQVAKAIRHLHQNDHPNQHYQQLGSTADKEKGGWGVQGEKDKILHRNIKPENIYVKEKERVALLGDFGHARQIKGEYTRLTSASGPPLYMSPEMYTKDQYNSPADVWSLGLILFETYFKLRLKEMIKWTEPPCDKSMYHHIKNNIQKIVNDRKERLQMQDLRKLVFDMLQYKAQKRPTIDQVCQRLEKIVNYFQGEEKKRFQSYKLYRKEGIEPQKGITVRANLKPDRFMIIQDEDNLTEDAKLEGIPAGGRFQNAKITLLTRDNEHVRVCWNNQTEILTLYSEAGLEIQVTLSSLPTEQKNSLFHQNFNFYQRLKAANKKFTLSGYNIQFKTPLEEIQDENGNFDDIDDNKNKDINNKMNQYTRHLPQAPPAPVYSPFGNEMTKKMNNSLQQQMPPDMPTNPRKNRQSEDRPPSDFPKMARNPNYEQNISGQNIKVQARIPDVSGMGVKSQYGQSSDGGSNPSYPGQMRMQEEGDGVKSISDLLGEINRLEAKEQNIQFSLLAHKYHCLALRYQDTGLHFKAKDCCQTALGYLNLQDPPDYEKQAKLYHLLGLNYQQSGKCQMAISCYSQAQQIRKKCKLVHTFEDLLLMNSFGEVYIELGQIQEAAMTFKKLLQGIRNIIDPRMAFLRVAVYINIANIMKYKGSIEQSIAYLTEALKLQKAIDPSSPNVSRIRVGLAKAQINLKMPLKAVEQLKTNFEELRSTLQAYNSEYYTLREVTIEMVTGLLGTDCSDELVKAILQLISIHMPQQVSLVGVCRAKLSSS